MRRAVLLALLLLGGCASLSEKDQAFLDGDRKHSTSEKAATGSCKPWFVSPSRDWGEGAPKHSCWNLLWEVPVALVAVPLALGIITAPVWGPILLLK